MTYNTIAEAYERVLQQKSLYERDLLNKSFLYAFVNTNNKITAIEVVFTKESYLHLTGLDYQKRQTQKRTGQNLNVRTGALEFYRRLGKDDKLINDISFVQGSTPEETSLIFKYTQHKLENLSQLTKISTKAEYIGKYKGNQDFDIIINRNKSAIAFIEENKKHIPVSSLYGRAEDVATDIRPVIAIFSRSEVEENYRIEYLNATVKFDKAQFDKYLLEKLTISSFENPNVKFNKEKIDIIADRFIHSEKNYITLELNEIAELRKVAYSTEEALNVYENKCKVFLNMLDADYKCDFAMKVLNKQLEQIEQSKDEYNSSIVGLIKDELLEIKNLQRGLSGAPHIYKVENKSLPAGISSDSALTVDDLQRKIFDDMLSNLKLRVGKIKNIVKRLFKFPHDKHNSTAENNSKEHHINFNEQAIGNPVHVSAPEKSEKEAPCLKEIKEMSEAREAFVAGRIPQSEYVNSIRKYITALGTNENRIIAADYLRKQLAKAPENMKKYISFELNNIEMNIKRDALQSSLSELKRAAHEQYMKQQSERESSPHEEQSINNQYQK